MKLLIRITFVIASLVGFANEAFSQVDRARVIVAYLNNFANYTVWPQEFLPDTFHIAVFTTDAEVISELQLYARNRQIHNKPVILFVYRQMPARLSSHIVLVTRDQVANLPLIYDLIGLSPVLLVSDQYPDRRNVMINLYESPEQELLFEVNEANIKNQGLDVDPEILLAGGTILDVASLYRESQQSLRDMKIEMTALTDTLEALSEEIARRMQNMEALSAEINAQRNMLANQEDAMQLFQQTIDNQMLKLEDQQDSMLLQRRFLDSQRNDMSQLLIDYEHLQEQWSLLEEILLARQAMIDSLDGDILEKNIALGEQSEVIDRQRQFLYLLGFTGFVTLVLILTIFYGYQRNKRKNSLLSEQQQQIVQKLRELQDLNTKLESADHYKSIFLASMSHELRTPLNSIIGYTGILLMGMAGELNAEQKLQLTKVKNNGSHLLSLINDVLDISKIEAGKVELSYEDFPLKDLVQEVVDTVYPRATEKKLIIETSIDDQLVITADRRRLKQVILNLATNAINYTDQGSICLKSRMKPGNRYRLSVIDTGIGIPPEDIGKLFSPFQQIESSLTKKNKGTGLGLYLCKKLMTMMDGDIFVRSEPGKGSRFYIEMPIHNDIR